MREPIFDIFSGSLDKHALWVEAVEGLTAARQRMEQIAEEKPGEYFIFSCPSHAILAKVDTSRNDQGAKSSNAA